MRLLSDNAATQDALGFDELAAFAAGVIDDHPDLPFTIGVFGEWGSGKTTLMNLIDEHLGDGVKKVWFNAWKYDGKEVLWNALIQKIFHTMLNDPAIAANSRKAEFRRNVENAAKDLATYAAKVAIRFVPGGILREEDVDAVRGILGSSANDPLYRFVNTFEETFDGLLKEFVGEDGYLVIFIDDLDRCLPENAITVLEALKLYLDRTNCVFVVGVEPIVIQEAISQRYRDNDKLSATAYLEKIVQLPIVVPRAKTGAAMALLEGAPFFDHGDRLLHEVVRRGTDLNPRRVKRFLNAFAVASAAQPEGLPIAEQRALAKMLLLQTAFPDFYRELSGRSHLLEKVEEAFARARGERDDDVRPDVERFVTDVALGRFLDKTREIRLTAGQIRGWGRVAGVSDPLVEGEEELAEV